MTWNECTLLPSVFHSTRSPWKACVFAMLNTRLVATQCGCLLSPGNIFSEKTGACQYGRTHVGVMLMISSFFSLSLSLSHESVYGCTVALGHSWAVLESCKGHVTRVRSCSYYFHPNPPGEDPISQKQFLSFCGSTTTIYLDRTVNQAFLWLIQLMFAFGVSCQRKLCPTLLPGGWFICPQNSAPIVPKTHHSTVQWKQPEKTETVGFSRWTTFGGAVVVCL